VSAVREIVVNTFVSLDGVMQAPGGPQEDPRDGFEYGGWIVGYWDEEASEAMRATMVPPFDLLLGRSTYEIFAAHWPYSEEPQAEALNRATKYVASTTLEEVGWKSSVLLANPVADSIRELKAGEGPELQVHGSSGLLQTLIAEGLVDRFRVWTFPLLLGKGRRLFGSGTAAAGLELVESRSFPGGCVLAEYRTGATIEPGSFVPDEPSEAELKRRAKLQG
jgi:dihydrofolate reductase